MYLIDGGFGAFTVLGVNGDAAFKCDSVVVLIGLAGEDEVLLCRQLAVKAIHAEVNPVPLLHGWEQQLRLANRHRVDRTDGLFALFEIKLIVKKSGKTVKAICFLRSCILEFRLYNTSITITLLSYWLWRNKDSNLSLRLTRILCNWLQMYIDIDVDGVYLYGRGIWLRSRKVSKRKLCSRNINSGLTQHVYLDRPVEDGN